MNRSYAVPVFFCLMLAGGAALSAGQQQGAVYLWVDKNGTPHYEDRPAEGTPVKELNLRYQLTDAQAMAANARQKSSEDDAAKLRTKQDADDKKKDVSTAKKTQDERADNCKAAKERLEKYETAHRLYKPMPNGDRQYLSDKELDAARAEAHKTVDEWCAK